MSDRRPDRVYAILVRDGRAFLANAGRGLAPPGGVFRPMAEDRKVELKVHLYEQLGIEARAIWAQGGFMYQRPGEEDEHFSGFYSVWGWDGEVPEGAGRWVGPDDLAALTVPPSLKILLLSVLSTNAEHTRPDVVDALKVYVPGPEGDD